MKPNIMEEYHFILFRLHLLPLLVSRVKDV